MSKIIKKSLYVVFFSVIMLCMMSIFASAETWKYNGNNLEIQVEGDFQYVLIEQKMLNENDLERGPGAAIVKYTGTSASVAIPSTLGGQPVVWITNGAFKDNTALQTVTIGESVKCIVSESFANCTGLQTVLIAKNVDSIGASAFSGCSALKSVTFQKGSVLKTISNNAFYNCTSLNNFTIPDTVEAIGDAAFWNCDSMTSIVIPDSVTSIGGAAFLGCNSLVEAEIGDGIEDLVAFRESWGDNWGTDSYYDGVFEGCISLIKVSFGKSVKNIGQDCFAGCGLAEIIIPDNVKEIGYGAFLNCKSATKIVIGSGVETIRYCAFENNTSAKSVSIGSNVLYIGDIAFRNCDSLKEIVIPTSVTSVGNAVFFSCDALEKAVIGNGLVELVSRQESWGDNWGTDSYYDGMFEGCTNLKEVTFGSAVKKIGRDCFAGTILEDVYIPDNVITIDHGAFMNCKVLEKIVIGNGVTSIGYCMFENDAALVDVTIGDGVVSIGDVSFKNCDALKEIYIPSNVTTMGNAMFFGCNNLEKVVIGNGVTALVTRQESWGDNWGTDSYYDGTFEGCIALKEVSLGSGIISIGTDTFAGTQITSLTVPGKVSTISKGAFAGAKQLKDIYFTGNWAASVGDSIFNGIADGYTVHYINGKIGYDDLSYNKAVFSPVTVTFDNNNDDVFAAPTESQILAPVGGYVIEPINPTAFGYLFAGWYKDSACTVKWDFAKDQVTSDTTLYAKWNSVDAVVPVRPENVTSTAKDGNSVSLQWSAVDGATGYNVYVDGKKVNDSTIFTTSYEVNGLNSSTTYEFVVTAVNSKGESENSIIFADRTTDHVHVYGEWTVTKEAGCVDNGEQTHSCECGAVETEEIPSLGGHTYGEWTVTKEATCSADGEKIRTCFCGVNETDVIPATGEHTFGDWVTVKPATSTEEGSKTRTCSGCGETETAVIPVITVMMGDMNGDGKITAADARIVLRISAQLDVPTDEQKVIADVNYDDKITASDARKILRVAAQLDTEF